MAKNKKPRKRYHQRYMSTPKVLPKGVAEHALSTFLHVAFLIETVLPRGELTGDEVHQIRDFINYTIILLATCKVIDEEYVVENYGGVIAKMQEAFRSYLNRHLKTGTTVASGDEINALREGAEVCSAIIEESIRQRPFHAINAFWYLKDQMDKDGQEEGKVVRMYFDDKLPLPPTVEAIRASQLAAATA